jgi:riboflavin kinase/FMN adenylyltransferase
MPTTIRTSAAARWTSLGEVPANLGPTVVVLGMFDGLHRGHAHLLAAARTLAAARRLPLVLVTFDPHPATIAGPTRDTTAIVSVDERIRLARRHGADHVLVLPFDNDLAAVPAEDFVRTVLLYTLHAVHVVVGENFRFGHRGKGDLDLLHRLGSTHGFTAHGIRLLDGCSSTRVRSLVANGDLPAATRILGRPLRLEGSVANGRVDVDPCLLLPPPGDYHAQIDDKFTMITIRADRTVWILGHPDGPITVGLVRVA